MEIYPGNPEPNSLPHACSPDALCEAIAASGFPLQIRVADQLRDYFTAVQPEWSYVDSDTSQRRNIDLLVTRALTDGFADRRCYGYGDLLIECKQSHSPYVFFLSEDETELDFPLLTGLRVDHLKVEAGEDDLVVSPGRYLGLHNLPFVAAQRPQSHNLTRAFFNKKRVELGGSDAYDSIVRPLMKATEYLERSQRPPNAWTYYHIHAVVPVAVLDAPMVGARLLNDALTLVMVPWVRVVRHSSRVIQDVTEDVRWAIDVVHASYLETYVEKHVLPFFGAFGERLAERHEALALAQEDPGPTVTWL